MDKSQHTAGYGRLQKALRKAREQAGLTQDDVVRRLGTYASFVSKIEAGKRRIDVVELAALCQLYDVSLFDLLRAARIGT